MFKANLKYNSLTSFCLQTLKYFIISQQRLYNSRTNKNGLNETEMKRLKCTLSPSWECLIVPIIAIILKNLKLLKFQNVLLADNVLELLETCLQKKFSKNSQLPAGT